MKKLSILFLLIFTTVIANQAQNVGIGINTPNASAMLDVTSTSRGLLIPRMTSAQRTTIVSPAKGLMVYDSTTNSFWFYNGSAWNTVAGAATFSLPYNETVALTSTAFRIFNNEAYTAVEGESADGYGVSGKSGTSIGVKGNSVTSVGVYGSSVDGYGMNASSINGYGIFASSANLYGIYAASSSTSAIYAQTNNTSATVGAYNLGAGIGLKGTSANGTAIEGISTGGVGVNASSVQNVGLQVTSTNQSAISATNSNAFATITATNNNGIGVAIQGNSPSHHAIVGISNGTSKNAIRGEATGPSGIGVYGTSSQTTGYGVYGNSPGGIALYGFTTSGTALKGISSSGYGLDVSGNVKIAGGNTSPVDGGVFTSDASGNAVWKKNKVAFKVAGVHTSQLGVAPSFATKVHFATELYDYDNNYALYTGGMPGSLTSTFAAPVAGLYHFDAATILTTNDFSDLLYTRLYLRINRSGTIIDINETEGVIAKSNIEASEFTATISTDVVLQAGDKVYVEVEHTNQGNASGTLYQWTDRVYFSGHLVFPN